MDDWFCLRFIEGQVNQTGKLIQCSYYNDISMNMKNLNLNLNNLEIVSHDFLFIVDKNSYFVLK